MSSGLWRSALHHQQQYDGIKQTHYPNEARDFTEDQYEGAVRTSGLGDPFVSPVMPRLARGGAPYATDPASPRGSGLLDAFLAASGRQTTQQTQLNHVSFAHRGILQAHKQRTRVLLGLGHPDHQFRNGSLDMQHPNVVGLRRSATVEHDQPDHARHNVQEDTPGINDVDHVEQVVPYQGLGRGIADLALSVPDLATFIASAPEEGSEGGVPLQHSRYFGHYDREAVSPLRRQDLPLTPMPNAPWTETHDVLENYRRELLLNDGKDVYDLGTDVTESIGIGCHQTRSCPQIT